MMDRQPNGLGEQSAEAQGAYTALEREIERVLNEESPRLAGPAQARHLARLYSQAESKRREPKAWTWSWLTPVPRWLQIAAIALIVVFVMNGISVAAADSLPGSPLYSFKRLTEQGNVLLSSSAAARARLWMELASRRLDEAQLLLRTQGRVDNGILDAIDESILRALSEIAATRGAERVDLLRSLTQLAARQETILEELAGQVQDASYRARLQQTARWLEGVATLAGQAPSQTQPATPAGTSAPATQPAGAESSATAPPARLASPVLKQPEATEAKPTPHLFPVSTAEPEDEATPTATPARPTVPRATTEPEPTENASEEPTQVHSGEDSTPSPEENDDHAAPKGTQAPAPARTPTEEN